MACGGRGGLSVCRSEGVVAAIEEVEIETTVVVCRVWIRVDGNRQAGVEHQVDVREIIARVVIHDTVRRRRGARLEFGLADPGKPPPDNYLASSPIALTINMSSYLEHPQDEQGSVPSCYIQSTRL